MTTPLTTRYLSCAETAKLVRDQLRTCFPGTKFSVRSDSYSMGASISMSWTDGPTERAVEDAVARYRRSWFDGTDDSTHHYESTLMSWPDGTMEMVHFGADHIQGHRQHSAEYTAQLQQMAAHLLRLPQGTPFEPGRWYHQDVTTDFGYWPEGPGNNLVWFLAQHIPAPAAAAQPPRKRSRA